MTEIGTKILRLLLMLLMLWTAGDVETKTPDHINSGTSFVDEVASLQDIGDKQTSHAFPNRIEMILVIALYPFAILNVCGLVFRIQADIDARSVTGKDVLKAGHTSKRLIVSGKMITNCSANVGNSPE